ncbi:MAG: hypothetical protein HY240_01230 [Actinobacteria bacterium]|nr:hypothetical protein [Actinomycetota bacterium]
MQGSAGVMALVLGQTVAGAAALLWLVPLWSEVKRGYFKLSGVMLAILAFAWWRSAVAGQVAGNDAGRWTTRLALATVLVTLAWTLLLFVRQQGLAHALGFVSVPVSAAGLFVMGGAARQPEILALFQLAAGGAFLGAVLDGLLLGHWYLTDRGLSRAPINRYTVVLLVAVAVEVVSVLSAGFGGVASSNEINPLLTAGALAPWIALGMVGTTALIAVLVKLALKGERASAVQSATGFFYLAVVTAFTAEVAVKVRFLPG